MTLTTLLSRDRVDAEFVGNVSGGVVSPQGDVFAFSTYGSSGNDQEGGLWIFDGNTQSLTNVLPTDSGPAWAQGFSSDGSSLLVKTSQSLRGQPDLVGLAVVYVIDVASGTATHVSEFADGSILNMM